MNPRPQKYDAAILLEAARQIAPKVKKWLNDDTELADIEADLVKAIKYNDDGYEIARSLDGQYCPDATLVEILDDAGWAMIKALGKAQAEWVKANNIQEIPLETKVRWRRKPEAGVGVVTKNHPDGKSTVTFESLGQKPGFGYIVEWENLTLEAV
jgi:hypothetical protein